MENKRKASKQPTNNQNKEKNKKQKKKIKEECKFDLIENDLNQKLDLVFKGSKIFNKKIDGINDLHSIISNLIGEIDNDMTEDKYRIKLLLGNASKNEEADNFKIIGKLGSGKTILYSDEITSVKDYHVENVKNKPIELKTNYCVFKGKWIYEVLLLSNMEVLVGWTQYNIGIYDLLKKSFIDIDNKGNYCYSHYEQKGYTDDKICKIKEEFWNVGDVIGVGIDLEKNSISIYRNGNPLDLKFDELPIGENKAYFPTILLNSKQRVRINFGQEKLFYNYAYGTYNPLDLPEGIYKNITETSRKSLEILNKLYFPHYIDENFPKGNLYSIFSDIFYTLANYTLEDEYSIKEAFIPFLLTSNHLKNENYFNDFMKKIYLQTSKDNKKHEIFIIIIECIISEIEKKALRCKDEVDPTFFGLYDILQGFLELKCNTNSFEIWISSSNFVKTLEKIFNFNITKFTEFRDKLESFRKEFISKEENKIFQNLSKKFETYQICFLNEFFKWYYDKSKKEKEQAKVKSQLSDNIQDFNKSFDKEFYPRLVHEKIKSFLNFILFKKEEDVSKQKEIKGEALEKSNNLQKKYASKPPILSISKNNLVILSDENHAIPLKSSIEPHKKLRENVLDAFIKTWKYHYSHDSYDDDIFFKINELADFGKMNFLMFFCEIFFEKMFNNKDFLNQISILNWLDTKNPFLKQNHQEYFLGGTSNNVKNEYLKLIVDCPFVKNENKTNEMNKLFHYFIYFLEILKRFISTFTKGMISFSKTDVLKHAMDLEKEPLRKFILLIYCYTILFSPRNVDNINAAVYFLVNAFEEIDNKNPLLIFLFPKTIFSLPFEILNFINKYTNFSKQENFSLQFFNLNNHKCSNKLNNSKESSFSVYPFFKNKNDFLIKLFKFYLKIYSNEKIKNPEVRELLNYYNEKFIASYEVRLILSELILIEYFFKGLLLDYEQHFLSLIASQNFFRLTNSFSLVVYGTKSAKDQNLLVSLKDFASNNLKIFENLCGKIFNQMNKSMTEFTQDINSVYNILFGQNNVVIPNPYSKSDAIKKFVDSSRIFSEYMILIEIMIKINTKHFLDEKNLLFTSLINLLTNISTRIANKNSFKRIKDILTYNSKQEINSRKIKIFATAQIFEENIKRICYPMISIMHELNKVNAFKEDSDFLKNLSSCEIIEFENFNNIINDLKGVNSKNILENNENLNHIKLNLEIMKKSDILTSSKSEKSSSLEDVMNDFRDLMNHLVENKNMRASMKMNIDESKDKNESDSLCFICYSRDMNTTLNPCLHKVCNICLMQYLVDNKKCFLCAKNIVSYLIDGSDQVKYVEKLSDKK